jgi:hypothetical protein
VFRIPATVLEARLGEEMVLLDLATERYVVLDPIGTLWWIGIASGLTEDEIVSKVVATYDVEEQQAKVDGRGLVSTLTVKGLVVTDKLIEGST